MSTFLFDKIIFGPVKSRRLGVSLGVNLLPVNRKVCNFNCIYCECGWSDERKIAGNIPTRQEVFNELEKKLNEMVLAGEKPDVITFAGNGEPTIHPEFTGIIDDCIKLRNQLVPTTSIAVLSNSTTINKPAIRESLLKVDKNILKLDSVSEDIINALNKPLTKIDVPELISNLASFKGKLIIQTLFVRGIVNGLTIDNTIVPGVDAWLAVLGQIKPAEVMIYTIARETPDGTDLKKVSVRELNEIAKKVKKLGIKTSVTP